MSGNPATADLEEPLNENVSDKSNKSTLQELASAIETILSTDNFDQKTIITTENEIGLIGIDVLQAHMKKSFKYEFPSLIALKDSKQQHAVSVGGKRSDQIVEVLKSVQTNIISGEGTGLGSRIMGRR